MNKIGNMKMTTNVKKKTRTYAVLGTVATLVLAIAPLAEAKDYSTSTVAIGGYDAVAYQTQHRATRGSGDHVAVFRGETYLFANEQNKKAFEASPLRYTPAYGGYCAYGVAVKKKFVGDPEIWRIVGGRLYLNLNAEIQKIWNKDVSGNIAKAQANWPKIRAKAPSEL